MHATQRGQTREECSFYSNVGACRHGSKCVRKHSVPSASRCVVLRNTAIPDPPQRQAFMRAVYVELALLAEVCEFAVAANESAHLKGNVYVQFGSVADAQRVLADINSRWLNGVPVFADFVPMNSLRSILCRAGDRCPRALECNYVHPFQFSP